MENEPEPQATQPEPPAGQKDRDHDQRPPAAEVPATPRTITNLSAAMRTIT